MEISDFLAPVAVDRFMADTYGRVPLHLPRGDGVQRRAPLDWPRLNGLLAIRSHWVEANIKLIMNGVPVQPAFYMDTVATRSGPSLRADPAKVNVFLAMGASLVADSIDDIAPEVREIAELLAAHFGARAEANAYCSFQNIHAFASHCDLHEVFVVHCEGEKVWNIYENRAAAPVAPLEGDDAQALIDAAKGKVLRQVTMRPGDLLYIPRGYYHDALASSEASLHVTFSVAPLTGRILFPLLEEIAIEDRAFREYLADARAGDSLPGQLAALGDRLSRLVRSPRLLMEIEARQRALAQRPDSSTLPERKPLSFFARTQRQAKLEAGEDDVTLCCGSNRIVLGSLRTAAEWLLGRPAFSLEELAARFPGCDPAGLRDLVRRLQGMGLIVSYQPQV